jgi:hypothetical protein
MLKEFTSAATACAGCWVLLWGKHISLTVSWSSSPFKPVSIAFSSIPHTA